MSQPARQVPRDIRRLMTQIAEFVCDHWQDLDRGIWEERGPERAFVYSRAMCWVALDRAITLISRYTTDGQLDALARHSPGDPRGRGGPWLQRSAWLLHPGLRGRDGRRLESAPPTSGYLPPNDPRIQSTVRVTGELLADHGALLFRYLVEEGGGKGQGKTPTTDDGLRGGEGAFLACAFWYVGCLCLVGRVS